jgi:UDP:flavonoid glycosyltransferase YjiC (YdhE family)
MFAPMSYMLSHVCRCVEIGKILRDQGHEVVFAVENPERPGWRSHVAVKNGFRCHYTMEQDYGYIFNTFEKGGFLAVGLALLRLGSWTPLDKIFEGYVEAIEAEKPDIIVGDASIAASNAAYVKGIPAVGIQNSYAGQFLSWPSITGPAIYLWDKIHLERFRRPVYRKYNVKPIDSVKLLKSIPMISPDLPDLYDYPDDWNWKMVGPILSEPPTETPDWFSELDDGTRNIYFSLGTTGMLDPLLRRVYDAFSKLPYRFIVTTGGQASEETVAMAPGNFRITDYAPGREILKRSEAIIFHGGNSTMYQALEAGVPMIALWNQLEQKLTGAMIEKRGFGLYHQARKTSAEWLVNALKEIMENPKYRQASQRYSADVANAQGAVNAAKFLVEFARNGEPCGPETIRKWANRKK